MRATQRAAPVVLLVARAPLKDALTVEAVLAMKGQACKVAGCLRVNGLIAEGTVLSSIILRTNRT